VQQGQLNPLCSLGADAAQVQATKVSDEAAAPVEFEQYGGADGSAAALAKKIR